MEFVMVGSTSRGDVYRTVDADGFDVVALFHHGEVPWQWSDGTWYDPAHAPEWFDEPFVETRHDRLFDDVPVGSTVWRHWRRQDARVLDAVAVKIEAHGANPWVFAADARHFDQFAGDRERAAYTAMSAEERTAILCEPLEFPEGT